MNIKSLHVPRPGVWRFSAASFLGVLILFYLMEPYLEDLPEGHLWRVVNLTLVLFSGVQAVGERRRTLVWAAVLAGTAIALLWVSHLRHDILPRQFPIGITLLFALYVSIRLLRFILTAPTVGSEVLCAAVATYLMFGLMWTLAYILVGMANPQAFAWTVTPGPPGKMDGFTALYFSLTTQATLGSGDIVPMSPTARLFAMVQAVAGMFYVTLLVARLVSVYSAKHEVGDS